MRQIALLLYPLASPCWRLLGMFAPHLLACICISHFLSTEAGCVCCGYAFQRYVFFCIHALLGKVWIVSCLHT